MTFDLRFEKHWSCPMLPSYKWRNLSLRKRKWLTIPERHTFPTWQWQGTRSPDCGLPSEPPITAPGFMDRDIMSPNSILETIVLCQRRDEGSSFPSHLPWMSPNVLAATGAPASSFPKDLTHQWPQKRDPSKVSVSPLVLCLWGFFLWIS